MDMEQRLMDDGKLLDDLSISFKTLTEQLDDIAVNIADTAKSVESRSSVSDQRAAKGTSNFESSIARSSFLFQSVSYEVYKRDMWNLARFVNQKAFMRLRNPVRLPLPDSAALRDQYCAVLPFLARADNEHVLETLERWNVCPTFLRLVPLREDMTAVNYLDVNGYSRITVLGVLEMLQTAFTHMQYAWVPTVSNEPAVFWYSGMR
jgi:hypothetical protein